MDREVGVVGRVDPAIHKIGMAELVGVWFIGLTTFSRVDP
jgi:hypothetical protein